MNKQLYYYLIFGLKVKSDIELTYAFPIYTDEYDVVIEQVIFPEKMQIEKLEELAQKSGSMVHHSKRYSCIHFSHEGTFEINNGSTIHYQLRTEARKEMVDQIILFSCFGIILEQRDLLAIHGSAVYWNNTAIVISGKSGTGKSSLTGELLYQGAELIADDTACIYERDGQLYIEAGLPIRKLCKDVVEKIGYAKENLTYLTCGEKGKYVISESQHYHVKPECVSAMFIIEPKETEIVEISEITGNEKLELLIPSLYNLNLMKEIGFSSLRMQQCIKFCNDIALFQLNRPIGRMTTQIQAEKMKDIIQRVEDD